MSAFEDKADICNAHSNVRYRACILSSKYVPLIANSLRPLSHGGLLSYRMLLTAFLVQMSKDPCVAIDGDMVG